MNFIPAHLFNLKDLEDLKISGRGGKEKDISSLFPTAKRVSSPLYDFVIVDGENEYKLEIKKQANDQWFDIRKYHNLTEQAQYILMLFVIHRENKVETIAIIQLGRLLEILMTHSKFIRYGWDQEIIKTAYDLHNKCPELQFKAKLKVLPFFKEFHNEFQIIYSS